MRWYRMVLGLGVLLFLPPGHVPEYDLHWVAELPGDLFEPPYSPFRFLLVQPSPAFVELLHFAVCLAFALLGCGFGRRWMPWVAGALLFYVSGLLNSGGKINHSILLLLAPFVLGALELSEDHPQRRARIAGAFAIIIGFAWFTAGFAKILGGWLDPSKLGVRGHQLRHYIVYGRSDLLAPWAASLDVPWLWAGLDWVVVGFEVGFLFAAFRPRLFPWWLAAAVFFHAGTSLFLNIAFLVNLFAYAVFVPWTRILGAPPAFTTHTLRRALTAALALALALSIYAWGSPLCLIQLGGNSDLRFEELVGTALAIVVTMVLLMQWIGTRTWWSVVRRGVSGKA